RLQMRRDELRRAHFLTGELRMLVYVATPGDDAVHHRWHAPIDIRRERRCTRLLHNEREEEQRQRHGGQVWGGMISKGSFQRSSVHRTLTPVPRTTLDSVSMSSQPEQSGYYRKGFGLKAEVQPDLAQYEGQVVDYLREHDYTLTVGDVTIRLAHEFGFCYGVERAVEYAYQTRRKFPDRRLFFVGGIIPNPPSKSKHGA